MCYAPVTVPDVGKHSLEIKVIIKSNFSKAEPCRIVEAMGSSPDTLVYYVLSSEGKFRPSLFQ